MAARALRCVILILLLYVLHSRRTDFISLPRESQLILKISKRGPPPFFKEEKAWEEMFSMRKLVKRLNWEHKELKDLLVPNNYQQKL